MEWKQINFRFTGRYSIEIDMPDALRCQLLPHDAVEALKEWWEWFSGKYTALAFVEILQTNAVLRIRYDFSDDYDKCLKACRKEGKSIDECSPMCIDQAGEHSAKIFEEIRKKLDDAFSKYRVFYETEEGWEYSERYLHVYIPL